MRLGKKAKMEKGTFMAYACTCNCLCYCSNCQTIANVQGKATTKSINTNNTTNRTSGTLILMG